ncbi:malate dehydrogenase [Chloroflexota bacterium]
MKICIIGGAGCLGSSTAFNIVIQGLADELVLIDQDEGLATLHVMDLLDTLVPCNQEMQIQTGSYKDMGGSDLVIITASVPNREGSRQEYALDNLPIMQEIARGVNEICPDTITIIACNPVETLNYSLYLLRANRDRSKFIGYASNDHFRLRKNVAEALDVKPSDVEGIVVGEHGDSQVPLFSSIRVNDKPVTLDERIKEDIRKKPRERMEKWLGASLARTSGWVSGVGMAAVVRTIRDDTREMFICSAILAGEYGYKGISMSVPVILGRGGILQIQERELLPDERERLEQSVRVIKESTHYIDEALGITL